MNEAHLHPTPQHERLVHLDALRGFALAGVLLVNFKWFTQPAQLITWGVDAGLEGVDGIVEGLIFWLADGKFYPLFSMLFGAGFALMGQRAKCRGHSFSGLYVRRALLLLLIGLTHGLFIWSGDILLPYALIAFVMLVLFSRTPLHRLWKWAVFFIALPPMVCWAIAGIYEMAALDPEIREEVMAEIERDWERTQVRMDRIEALNAKGTYAENVAQRAEDLRWMLSKAPWYFPPILGFFLLGRWLFQSGRLAEPGRHAVFFRRWFWWGMPIGLALAALNTRWAYGADMLHPTRGWAGLVTLHYAAGGVLAMGYLSAVVLGVRRLIVLAPVGRMTLSHYLFQSLFWTWVFYGYGLGLWAPDARALHAALALLFFAGQAAFSHWWFSRFRYGPVEWLWRYGTYRKHP